jgi:hypothetical protein
VWSTTVSAYTRESSRNLSSNKLEPEQPQHDNAIAYVIAQQYFSASILSLCFHYHNKNFGATFKNVIYFSFLLVEKNSL